MSIKTLNHFDSLKLSLKHVRVSLIAGMGFFTDAYDLFSITIVLYILSVYAEPSFPLNLKVLSLPLSAYLATSAILFAIVGQLLFGIISDKLGRKKVYGLEATLLALGAILSAFSPNIYWLIASRALLGVGIGGDYPVSSVIASEYGNAKDRGKMVALVFSNQGLGIIAAVLVGIVSALFIPPSIAWRTVLGVAAIPALAVIYFRRKMPETPRYSYHVKKDINELKKAAEYFGIHSNYDLSQKGIDRAQKERSSFSRFIKNYWKPLLITTTTWFILDIALYGTGVYSSFITSTIVPQLMKGTLSKAILMSGLPYIVGLPGYFSAVALIDRAGRKALQIGGFVFMAVIYFLTSFTLQKLSDPLIAFSLFAMSFYAINLGPNTTTFIIPSEIYPTSRRSTGHGISAAAGKLGAAISTLYMPIWKITYGLPLIFLGLGLLSLTGAVLTTYLEEPKGVPLEIISNETQVLV